MDTCYPNSSPWDGPVRPHPMAQTVLPLAQWQAAYDLACAYGHTWPSQCERDGPIPLADCCERARRADADRIIGQCCPTVTDAGGVEHTTGTGRTTWAIAPDGTTSIIISRPDGAGVIHAWVRSNTATLTDCGGELYPRHWEALALVAIALRAQWGLRDRLGIWLRVH